MKLLFLLILSLQVPAQTQELSPVDNPSEISQDNSQESPPEIGLAPTVPTTSQSSMLRTPCEFSLNQLEFIMPQSLRQTTQEAQVARAQIDEAAAQCKLAMKDLGSGFGKLGLSVTARILSGSTGVPIADILSRLETAITGIDRGQPLSTLPPPSTQADSLILTTAETIRLNEDQTIATPASPYACVPGVQDEHCIEAIGDIDRAVGNIASCGDGPFATYGASMALAAVSSVVNEIPLFGGAGAAVFDLAGTIVHQIERNSGLIKAAEEAGITSLTEIKNNLRGLFACSADEIYQVSKCTPSFQAMLYAVNKNLFPEISPQVRSLIPTLDQNFIVNSVKKIEEVWSCVKFSKRSTFSVETREEFVTARSECVDEVFQGISLPNGESINDEVFAGILSNFREGRDESMAYLENTVLPTAIGHSRRFLEERIIDISRKEGELGESELSDLYRYCYEGAIPLNYTTRGFSTNNTRVNNMCSDLEQCMQKQTKDGNSIFNLNLYNNPSNLVQSTPDTREVCESLAYFSYDDGRGSRKTMWSEILGRSGFQRNREVRGRRFTCNDVYQRPVIETESRGPVTHNLSSESPHHLKESESAPFIDYDIRQREISK